MVLGPQGPGRVGRCQATSKTQRVIPVYRSRSFFVLFLFIDLLRLDVVRNIWNIYIISIEQIDLRTDLTDARNEKQYF